MKRLYFHNNRLFMSLALLISGLASLCLTACGDLGETKVQGYGLPIVQIEMTTESLGLLNGQILSKRPVAGTVRLKEKRNLHCEVSFSGQSSLNDYRKSFNMRNCKGDFQDRKNFRLGALNRDQTTIRSIIGYQVFGRMGLAVPLIESVAAYMNDDFLGVYNLIEPIDSDFYHRRGMAVTHIFQARYGNAGFKKETASDVSIGFHYEGDDRDNFAALQGLYNILWEGTSDEVFAQKLNRLLDVDSFMSYMAASVFMDHWDGFNNNFYLALDANKQRVVTNPWDLDRIWEKVDERNPSDLIQQNELLARMLKIPEYRTIFLAKLDALRLNFPLGDLLDIVEMNRGKVRKALSQDMINGPTQDANFELLKARIASWYSKVEAFQADF